MGQHIVKTYCDLLRPSTGHLSPVWIQALFKTYADDRSFRLLPIQIE